MTVPTEGEVFFRGVALRIHDPFFPRAATFKGEEVRLPTLEVRQERRFLSREGGRRDARPVSRPSLANTGETVRSFRKFGTGDDIRTIDWKISAKQGSLYVRVYADEEARPPLIFVDLPRKGASSRAQAAMKEAVRGAIAASVERHGRASLMAVRGPNLLVYLPLEADYARAMQALARSAGKATEEAHFYRARTPPSLRADLNAIMHRSGNGNGNGHGAAPAYRERLAAAYGSVLRGREQTVYERQVAQAVWRLRPHHIELFSCKDGGDQSHLEFVVYIAEYVGVQVDLWKQNGHGWAGVAGRTPPLKGAEVIR
nr:DUF58 domain-containing protein [Methanofollis sp. W23]